MNTIKRKFLVHCLKIFDVVFMLIALLISLLVYETPQGQHFSLWELFQVKLKLVNFIALLIFIATWHLLFLSMKLYDSRRLDEGKGEWKDIVRAVLIGTMMLLAVTVIFQRTHVSRQVLLLFAVLTCVFTWSARALMRVSLGWVRRHRRNLRRLLLVGSNRRAHDLACRVTAKPQLGYSIVGYVDDPPYGQSYQQRDFPCKHLGTLLDFDAVVAHEDIDEIVICLPIRSCYEPMKRIIAACEIQGIQLHLLSDFFQLKLARARATEFEGIPMLTLETGTIAEWSTCLKRAFDLVIASFLVVLLAPVFLLIALLIKLLSPGGPVFFVQTRVGYNRRRFRMIKFRTMIPNAEQLQPALEASNEAQGPAFKIKNDPRVTRLGRVLRKTSVDELPQLFNVIAGHMSLVGPRPLPLRDVQKFEEPWLKRRFSVKPGITCLWQVNGRSNAAFDTWIEQDLQYIDHWSFGLDMKILAKTIPAVLRGTGAH